MKGLVVSWFFPPATSAEGLVTFKLLKNSSFEYDVVYAQSRQWSYDRDSALASGNIRAFPVEADSPADFARRGAEQALRLLSENAYDFMMTRAMPPQSHTAGLAVRRRHPGLFWIASMADPIGHNPYDYDRYFNRGTAALLSNPLRTAARLWIYRNNIRFDERVTQRADLLIYPSMEQCRFSLGERYGSCREKILILPHSYDPALWPAAEDDGSGDGVFSGTPDAAAAESAPARAKERRTVLAHLGHLNSQRSAAGLIRAAALLLQEEPALASRLLIRLVGNLPADQKELIADLGVGGIIRAEEPVDYAASLAIMRGADMLLLIDAKFSFLSGNIFFPSKLADYMGADKSILGLTSQSGPSGSILREAGCPVCDPEDVQAIRRALGTILREGVPPHRRDVYRRFASRGVAERFDAAVTERLSAGTKK
jgi:hypothetical protein